MKRGRFALIAATLLALATPLTSHAQPAPGCSYVLGFKTLHDLDPNDTGDCVTDQASATNGDATQATAKGLMAWRKGDNWTAFTNGYTTWINGPNGLVSRLNTQRFPWEADFGAANTTKLLEPNGQPLTIVFDRNLVLKGAVQAADASGKTIDMQPTGQWVNVYFDARNNGTRPATLDSGKITIGDSQGRSYLSPFDLRQIGADGQEVPFNGVLQPGSQASLRLTFDIAKDATGGVLHVPGGNVLAVV
jgi:hypothetical protein